MPRCQGRPEGPCPAGRNDNTVRLSQGDLELCHDCEVYRFPYLAKGKTATKQSGAASRKTTEKSESTVSTVSTTPVTTAVRGKTATKQSGTASRKTTERSEHSQSEPAEGSVGSVSTTPANTVVVNELLAYLSFHRNAASQTAMTRVCVNFYGATEISAVKKCLINIFRDKLDNTAFITERRSTTSRPAHEAEFEDIISTMNYLDTDDLLKCVSFAAVELNRLPGYSPEATNICSVIDKQNKFDSKLESLSCSVDEIRQAAKSENVRQSKTDVLCSDNSMAESFQSVQQKLDELNRLVKSLRCHVEVARSTVPTEEQRAKNIVVFGLPETRDSGAWRSQLMDVLELTAGRSVEISDAFRIGVYSTGKTRPVIAKLNNVWDKRIVLSNCRQLSARSDYMKKVFIVSDEPVEVRRKRTLERLRSKAEREQKVVQVTDDNSSLYVDGVLVFTMKDGLVRECNSVSNLHRHKGECSGDSVLSKNDNVQSASSMSTT